MGLDMYFYSDSLHENEIHYDRKNYYLARWIENNVGCKEDAFLTISNQQIQLLLTHINWAIEYFKKCEICLSFDEEYNEYTAVFNKVETYKLDYFCGGPINLYEDTEKSDKLTEYNVDTEIINELVQMKSRFKSFLEYKEIYYLASW